MRFAQPYFTLFIFVILGLILFYIRAFWMRKRIQDKFAQKGLLVELLAQVDLGRQRIKAILLILGLTLCFFALLRPQWGFKWQEVKRKGLDIIIALDTSKSMLATDIKPSRLERAKLAIGDFTQNLKGDRAGLIAFAGSAFLSCPLTIDYGGFLLSLENVDVHTIPRGGTSISSAIKEAIRSYPAGESKFKVLIVITDGEDHDGDALGLAQEAKKEGIIICCIGIGTKEGELVFLEQEDGRKEFLKDNAGNAVKSSLNEDLLQKISLATGGTYIRSTNTNFGLDLLYQGRLSKMEKREFEGKMNKFYEERFQLPLFLGLILLALEIIISDRKK
ncbi:MAG: VWA domain-containing protein [Candidatus Omnitrophica bacterium]|nr:VWA domain-containing protein [Candidatus Omnitrophota bacterium]MBU4303804.1 VWA domain-containing protein [Candidatus Omnitrophota bacterium]MBU4418493.1 VWA domain-containing protein [Candidatus Omnitrophota bacterium]MBU4467995.1 VWA domain-containing protein [Candidatus Omnitrophota bacterium]MCG2707792.1 VWA domain-containing protein [Candidatus Omnitrophota bacterium]